MGVVVIISFKQGLVECNHQRANMFIKLKTPSTHLLVGQTQTGKTHYAKRIIECRDQMFNVPPVAVKYVYEAWQPMFEDMPRMGVDFHQGIPTGEELKGWSKSGDHVLIVLDDVMHQACASPEIMSLFTIQCHHRNASVMILAQNIFPPGRCARTISLNCHYITLFNTKRDRLQVQTLGKQIFPGQVPYFMDAYRDATAENYGYILCDLHPGTDKTFQLRSRIFPEEFTWYYTPHKDGEVEQTKAFVLEQSAR